MELWTDIHKGRDLAALGEEWYSEIIREQTNRALWEVGNVIKCIPEDIWGKEYCGMPLWKHVYHMLHSLDLWFMNPNDTGFEEPGFHVKDLNNLDVVTEKEISREQIHDYFVCVERKIKRYIEELKDEELLESPEGCKYTALDSGNAARCVSSFKLNSPTSYWAKPNRYKSRRTACRKRFSDTLRLHRTQPQQIHKCVGHHNEKPYIGIIQIGMDDAIYFF